MITTFVGFLDATYLTVQHYFGAIPFCVITTGCETVLTSEWHKIFGIPVAFIGAIYYLFLFLLTIAYLDSGRRGLMLLAASATPIGFIASIWFVYLQFFVLKEICSYCVVSALTSTTLFIIGILIIVNHKRSKLSTRSTQL